MFHMFHSVTVFEISCLAKIAGQYPLSGPAYVPQVPNQLHRIPNCAREVLLGGSYASLHYKFNCFAYKRLKLCPSACILHCAAYVCHSSFH